MIQRSAARLCFNNYSKEPGVITDMQNKLKWPSHIGLWNAEEHKKSNFIVKHTISLYAISMTL